MIGEGLYWYFRSYGGGVKRQRHVALDNEKIRGSKKIRLLSPRILEFLPEPTDGPHCPETGLGRGILERPQKWRCFRNLSRKLRVKGFPSTGIEPGEISLGVDRSILLDLFGKGEI